MKRDSSSPQETPLAKNVEAARSTPDFRIDDCELFGGGMCPEQYDVYLNGVQIGYLRLRHGTFRADYPDVGGETVYRAHPEGDGLFMDYEREDYLKKAVAALKAHRSLYE